MQTLQANFTNFWINGRELVTNDFKSAIRKVGVIFSSVIRSLRNVKIGL